MFIYFGNENNINHDFKIWELNPMPRELFPNIEMGNERYFWKIKIIFFNLSNYIFDFLDI